MITLGESFSNILFLTREVFRHKNEKYTMLAISNLWMYLNGIVVAIQRVLYLTVRVVLSISATFYLAAEVFKTAFLSDHI